MTFWQRVESALYEQRISEAELSRRIGLNQSSINSWKVRGSLPRADIAVKTAEILKTSVEYLISGKPVLQDKSRNLFLIPVLNQQLSAGKGSPLPETDEAQGLVEVPSFLREYKENIACLYVHGDSMQPTLNNGDMVVCSSLGWDKSEGLYAIRLNGNGYVKRIQVGAGKIFIISDNPKYPPIEEPIESENFEIIGKVLLTIKKAD